MIKKSLHGLSILGLLIPFVFYIKLRFYKTIDYYNTIDIEVSLVGILKILKFDITVLILGIASLFGLFFFPKKKLFFSYH